MSTSVDRLDTAYMRTSQQLSSGKRINSAADDAAGLAISEKMNAQARSWDRATDNAYDFKNLLQTAEGGLNQINDALIRIRELTIQSLNDTYTDSDRSKMQNEVNQLLDFIDGAARSTEFNTQKLLDGSFENKNAQVSANPPGRSVTIDSALLDALRINGYDISTLSNAQASFADIDYALSVVNDIRADLGAQMNRLDYTINANETSYLNQMQAMSRIADADIGKSLMERNRVQVLQQYQIMAQKEQMQRMGQNISLLQ